MERTSRAGDVPQVAVALASARPWRRRRPRFYGDPTAHLQTVGVTGTNGKTTTAFLVRALLEADGRQTGLLGTVKSVIGGVEHEVERTTPEAIDLQRTFREMLDAGDRGVRDGGLLARARAPPRRRDPLRRRDLHQPDPGPPRLPSDDGGLLRGQAPAVRPSAAPARVVINVDDPYGARLAAELEEPITFALARRCRLPGHRASAPASPARSFTVHTPGRRARAAARRCAGEFNVYNVLGAFAAARALGVPAETCVRAIATAGQVPGRFETVDEGQPFAVLVDYAHTPDSLENVLSAARELTERPRASSCSAAAATATAASGR